MAESYIVGTKGPIKTRTSPVRVLRPGQDVGPGDFTPAKLKHLIDTGWVVSASPQYVAPVPNRL